MRTEFFPDRARIDCGFTMFGCSGMCELNETPGMKHGGIGISIVLERSLVLVSSIRLPRRARTATSASAASTTERGLDAAHGRRPAGAGRPAAACCDTSQGAIPARAAQLLSIVSEQPRSVRSGSTICTRHLNCCRPSRRRRGSDGSPSRSPSAATLRCPSRCVLPLIDAYPAAWRRKAVQT